jgi:hypothetical protein
MIVRSCADAPQTDARLATATKTRFIPFSLIIDREHYNVRRRVETHALNLPAAA